MGEEKRSKLGSGKDSRLKEGEREKARGGSVARSQFLICRL